MNTTPSRTLTDMVASAFQLLCTVPLWVTEIVPPTHRGMLVDIHAVM
jgi:hypothetical protein